MGDIGIGAPLRQERTTLGRSVEDVAAVTRMRSAQVRAIEDEQFGIFGGDVYAKGFIKSYAVEVGLDPEPLLDLYRHYVQHDAMDSGALTAGPVTRTSPRPAPPAWIGWAAGLALVVGGGFVLAQFVNTRVPAPAVEAADSPPPAPVPTPQVAPGGSAAPTSEPTPTPAPSPSPTFEGVNLVLAFEQSSWIRVSSGGTIIQEGTQNSGAAIEFNDPDEVVVRIGNAGGVRARLNGEDVGRLGEAGDVVEVRFTPEGVEPT
jgi:cytoskeletal protein RodZ